MNTVVALGHDGMGHGDTELGLRILRTFLQKSPALKTLRAVVLFNSGVRLMTRDSAVAPELRQLHENGVEIHPCGTCLETYQLTGQLAFGEPSNMDAIVRELSNADKVITL